MKNTQISFYTTTITDGSRELYFNHTRISVVINWLNEALNEKDNDAFIYELPQIFKTTFEYKEDGSVTESEETVEFIIMTDTAKNERKLFLQNA